MFFFKVSFLWAYVFIQVTAFTYPAFRTTVGTSIWKKDLHTVPKFAVGDKAIVTMKGELRYVTLTELFSWKHALGNEMKATVSDVNGLLMESSSLSNPYKFDTKNMQIFHEEGTTLLIFIEANYFIGVLKKAFIKEDPFKCEVTIITKIKKESGGSINVETESRLIYRNSFMRKVTFFL